MYDAAVAGILSARDYITDFREQYKGVVVSEVVPTFSEIVVRSTKARDLIAEGRYDAKSDDERVQGYLQIFRSLRDDVDLLAASEDDLNVKKLGIQRDRQRGKIGVIASVSIAVGSLIGALISGLAVYWSIMSSTCP